MLRRTESCLFNVRIARGVTGVLLSEVCRHFLYSAERAGLVASTTTVSRSFVFSFLFLTHRWSQI
jgi:hypothetical protein